MAAALFHLPTSRVFDSNGIADGATLTFYDTGTSTLRAVHTTSALTVEHPNPLTVAAGAAVPDIYLDDAYTYRLVVKNAAGVTIDDIDPYLGLSSLGVLFTQAGTGAVAETAQATLRRVVYAGQWGLAADGVTDDTSKVQAVLDAHPGKDIVFDGTIAISTITVSGDNTKLIFRNGAGFIYTVATAKPVNVTGDNVTLEGLHVTAPATFDGINTQPLYGVIWVTGDNCKIIGGKLTNVPKVGVMFSECEGGLVSQMTIEGNYPTASFTGTEVGHAGVLIDCRSGGREGNFIIEACNISECVQGVLIANYAAASRSQGIIVTGNNFYSIWNHGVYAAGITYANVVTGNTFVFCQVPVAMSGSYHIVSSNSITTGGSSGTITDQVGISLRDPINCVVANNVIQGETGTDQVVISLMPSSGTTVSGNVVSGNTMEITGSGSANMIAVGGATCADLTDNIVTGNVCVGVGRTSSGLIQLVGAAACPAYGTIISSNTTVARSGSYGIQLANVTGAAVFQNKLRLEHDAAGAITLGAITFAACTNCEFANNSITVTASWGTNVTFYGLWETGASTGHRASHNTFRADVTKLASATHYLTVSGSAINVDDVGAGAPNLNAGVGSVWRRTDGGAGTSFYVKEVGSDAAGWVGK